jgi:hypothetical protein
MTRLRPLVIPVAALTLATAAPSASAHPRRPVSPNSPWTALPRSTGTWTVLPRFTDLTAVHADIAPRAASVQPATSLPIAALANLGEAVTPDGRRVMPGPPATALVPGRPTLPAARGPPS